MFHKKFTGLTIKITVKSCVDSRTDFAWDVRRVMIVHLLDVITMRSILCSAMDVPGIRNRDQTSPDCCSNNSRTAAGNYMS